LTVKAITTTLNAEEIQVHGTPNGKVEIKRNERVIVKCFTVHTEMKERLNGFAWERFVRERPRKISNSGTILLLQEQAN
jgi:hypothetical protein